MKRPVKIGITGGIGSGKTFVCNLFHNLWGVEVFNTDEQVKADIIKRENVKRQVIAEFGQDSYCLDGEINRYKFRTLLFNNLSKKRIMDRIVGKELIPAINDWADKQTGPYVLVECAIIFENGVDKFLDGVIVVTCPKELRVERLLKRGVSQTDIDNVMRAQWSEEQKIKRADFVINNDSGVKDEVESLNKLLRIYAEKLATRKTKVLQHTREGTETFSI